MDLRRRNSLWIRGGRHVQKNTLGRFIFNWAALLQRQVTDQPCVTSWPLRYSSVQSNKDRGRLCRSAKRRDGGRDLLFSRRQHEISWIQMSDIQQFPFPPFLLPTLLPSVSFRLLSILFPPPVAHRAAVGSSSGFHFLGPAFGLQAVVDLILVDSEKPAFSPFKTNTREKKRLQVREF